MASEAKKRANAKYDKEHTQAIMLKLNKQTDADVLAMLESVENRQGYIKELVRRDLRGNGETLTIDAIRCLVRPVAKKYNIDKIYLFGSYARGEQTQDSDVDLLVEGGNMQSLYDLLDLENDFSLILGKGTDVVEEALIGIHDTRTNKRFRSHLERDKVLLYERT